jgi:putative sugar O-methyltransferase
MTNTVQRPTNMPRIGRAISAYRRLGLRLFVIRAAQKVTQRLERTRLHLLFSTRPAAEALQQIGKAGPRIRSSVVDNAQKAVRRFRGRLLLRLLVVYVARKSAQWLRDLHLRITNKIKTAYALRLVSGRAQSVVFVSPLLRAREIKMATALRSQGWKVVLLYKQTTPFRPGEFFDLAIRSSTEDGLHQIAMAIQPRLCHVFSGAVDDVLLQFCRDKPSPVVIDLNDIFCPSMFNYLQERFEPTKKALESADGICARDLQPKFAERYDGFRISPHTLWFPEFSWKDGPRDDRALKKRPPDEIHVVSVGTISLETQGWYDSGLLQLAKMLVERKIHLHIYPHWFYRRAHGVTFNIDQKKDFADFVSLQETTQYVHLHKSLPLDELARELPQYDFGIISGGCEDFGQKLRFLTERYMQACYSGRISDYLDARLPILINREVSFNYWLLERNGVAVDLAGILKPGFREKLLAIKHDPAWKKSVDDAARRLSLGAHAHRLAKFYERVMVGKDVIRLPFLVKLAQTLPVVGPLLRNVEHTLRNSEQALRSLEHELQVNRRRINQLEGRVASLRSEIKMGGMGLGEVAGLLNWPDIQDDRERNNGFAELLTQMRLCDSDSTLSPRIPAGAESSADAPFQSISSAWELLNRKNLDQLLEDGYNNFKRTVALNYFTFPIQVGDPQITTLENALGSDTVGKCWRLAQSQPDDGSLRIADQVHYRYFVFLLWTYARRLDRLNILDQVREPGAGNPIVFPFDGQDACQDLANSLIEYYSMRESVSFDTVKRVAEIGGGYGRNAYMALALHPHIQYTLIDIPPALYVAQRYLSSVFPDRRVFQARDFRSFDEVRSEIEQASIIFLMPHQLSMMPSWHFGLTVNISSFGEMTRQQIEQYFAEVARTTSGWFYVKQWKVSKNPFDGLLIVERDYPWREDWEKVYSRTCAVQSNFFETLYKIGG